MTKNLNQIFSFILFAFLLNACDQKTESKPATAAEAIKIENPHIRELPPGLKVTAMYMKLKNTSSTNHELVKVEGYMSNMIELHTHTNENGVMRMGQVESIPVPANATAEAKPGSYHVMIMGLTQDPKLGDKFDFTLTFKDGTSLPITAEVKKIGAHSH